MKFTKANVMELLYKKLQEIPISTHNDETFADSLYKREVLRNLVIEIGKLKEE